MLASSTSRVSDKVSTDDLSLERSVIFRSLHSRLRLKRNQTNTLSHTETKTIDQNCLPRHEGSMKVEQLAVFLENGSDRLSEITAILAENGISIRALSLADTAAFAILRMIVNDNEKARQILQENGFTVGKNEILVLEVPDKPGGLASVLDIAKANKLQIEYMYAFVHKSGESGLIIFRFSEPDIALNVLTKEGVRVLSGEDIYAI